MPFLVSCTSGIEVTSVNSCGTIQKNVVTTLWLGWKVDCKPIKEGGLSIKGTAIGALLGEVVVDGK